MSSRRGEFIDKSVAWIASNFGVSVVLDKYNIIEAKRTWTIYNRLQYFSPASLKSEFERAGFALQGYCGNVVGSPFDENDEETGIAPCVQLLKVKQTEKK